MSTHPREVEKWIELQGRDERELAQRIDTFRDAIRAQKGVIVDITWSAPGTRKTTAAIRYQLPLHYPPNRPPAARRENVRRRHSPDTHAA